MQIKKYIITLLIAVAAVLPVAVLSVSHVGAAPKDQILSGVKSVDDGNTSDSALSDSVKNIINMMLYIAGAVAVIMIIIGGIRFIISNGNPETVKAARNTVLYAAIGIVVVVMAYAIVNFVIAGIAGGKTS